MSTCTARSEQASSQQVRAMAGPPAQHAGCWRRPAAGGQRRRAHLTPMTVAVSARGVLMMSFSCGRMRCLSSAMHTARLRQSRRRQRCTAASKVTPRRVLSLPRRRRSCLTLSPKGARSSSDVHRGTSFFLDPCGGVVVGLSIRALEGRCPQRARGRCLTPAAAFLGAMAGCQRIRSWPITR